MSGAKQTRYLISVAMKLQKDLIPGPWQEELQVVPKWWGDPPPVWIGDPLNYHAIEIGEEDLLDGVLAFTTRRAGAEVDGVRIALLDANGEMVREAVSEAGRHELDLSGLEPGTFVLTSEMDDDVLDIAAGAIALQGVPPVLR